MSDKVAEYESLDHLHIVHLHGDILKPEHGFILTEAEYSDAITNQRHHWYRRAAQDYLAFCPIFIGSQLAEPILFAELERAKRDSASVSGRAFLISPSALSPIKIASLSSKGIVHIPATLSEFVEWLGRHFRGELKPKQIIGQQSNYPKDVLDTLTRDDLEIARSIRVIEPADLRAKLLATPESQRSHLARQFLRGFPPTWLISSSDVPVLLTATHDLIRSLRAAIAADEKMFVAVGQAGSGKTTAVMMALLRIVEEDKTLTLYEVKSDVRSIRRALSLIKRIGKGKSIVYVGDLFVYGDTFKDDIERYSGQDVFLVSTARTGEWQEHLARRLGDRVAPITFERFVRKDYDPLIDRLVRYVPAPRFRRLSRTEQHAKLAASKSQLLIALREATESENFTDVITNEFEGLPDSDTQHLMLIVGVATLARVGISREAAAEAYASSAPVRSFDDALAALAGIVDVAENRRLFARHELYVRHVLENVAKFNSIHAVIRSILKTYVKYDIPIVRSVNRLDALLFRFILNHKFIEDHAERHGSLELGRELYSEFEVDFQLDGHFWLQYGLYLAAMKQLPDALEMLRKSIQAYPGNAFAAHALADVQLRAARERRSFDATTRTMIEEAVKSLKLQDAQANTEIDTYPMVTLAYGHISALIKHDKADEAQKCSKEYFDRLSQLERQVHSAVVTAAKEKVFRYATVGEW